MLLTPESAILSDDISVSVLLGGIWLGGVYGGVALARESPDPSNKREDSVTPQSQED